MNQTNTCTICNTEITQIFCPSCGQKIGKRDTTLKSLASDFFSNLFSLDKSVFAGILKIITNPKELVTNYWEGHRKYYPSPSKLFFYALAVVALHLTYFNELILGLTLEFGGYGRIIFWLIFFPMLTLTSYLGFIKEKKSLTKHIISVGYLASCFFIVIILLNDLLLYFSIDLNAWPFIFFVLSFFISNIFVFISKPSPLQIVGYLILQVIIFIMIVLGLIGSAYLLFPDQVQL